MQRWSPEKDDEANKGLSIIRDLLLPVKKATSSLYSPRLPLRNPGKRIVKDER